MAEQAPSAGKRRHGSRKPQPQRPVDPVRRLAWDVLRAVDERGAYANLVLPGLLRSHPEVESRDRALLVELAYGTLRSQGTLDHVLDLVSSRPMAEVDPPLRDVLRLGAYQLVRMRVPSHAAVATSVDLARSVAGEGASRFANAVLRRVAERGGELSAPDRGEDLVGHLAVETAHPRWVVEAVRDALGGDEAETEAALRADDERPEVHLVVRPHRLTRDALLEECAAQGFDAQAGPWSPYAVRLVGGGDPGVLPSVRSGAAAVQDEASQLVAIAAAALIPDDGVLVDMAAGPGGKAALLRGLRRSPVLAIELHHQRSVLTREALRSAHGDGAWLVATADARAVPVAAGSAAGVLLDAPCTGLGSLRRRPEARWRRQPEDLKRLVLLQGALLRSALGALRPGGVLVYAVCSPHRAEGVEHAERLASDPSVEVLDVPAALPGVPFPDGTRWVQTWTHRHGTDDLFVLAVRRV